MNTHLIKRLKSDSESYFASIIGKAIPKAAIECASWKPKDNELADLIHNIRTTGVRVNKVADTAKLRKKCCGCIDGISVQSKNIERKKAQLEVRQFLDQIQTLDLYSEPTNRTKLFSYSGGIHKKNPMV